MEMLVLAIAIIFIVWWLNLDRPARAAARAINSLASAGELRASSVLADTAKDVDTTSLVEAREKLQALRDLDL